MGLIGTKYVNPDSVLARTAWEMVQNHAGGLGPHSGMTNCPACDEPLPCTVGRAAAEVVTAAGLAESSGLVRGVRRGPGGPSREPGSPLGPSTTAAPATPSRGPIAMFTPLVEEPADGASAPEQPPAVDVGPEKAERRKPLTAPDDTAGVEGDQTGSDQPRLTPRIRQPAPTDEQTKNGRRPTG